MYDQLWSNGAGSNFLMKNYVKFSKPYQKQWIKNHDQNQYVIDSSQKDIHNTISFKQNLDYCM